MLSALEASHASDLYLEQIVCRSNIFNDCVMFVHHIQDREGACREQMTYFIIWRESCFKCLFSIDRLEFEHESTNYLIWHNSCLKLFINTTMFHAERHTGCY